MFKYTSTVEDIQTESLLFYKHNLNLKIAILEDKIYLYTVKTHPLYINRFLLYDINTSYTTNFLYKNILYIFNDCFFNLFQVVNFFGINYFFSKSLYEPVYEWYEREVNEKSKLFFINLSDTRMLLQTYTLPVLFFLINRKSQYP